MEELIEKLKKLKWEMNIELENANWSADVRLYAMGKIAGIDKAIIEAKKVVKK